MRERVESEEVKVKFSPVSFLTTVWNELVRLDQSATLHPYPRERERAKDGAGVLRRVHSQWSVADPKTCTKNAVLRSLGRLVTAETTPGEHSALASLRTQATAIQLDERNHVMTLDQTREALRAILASGIGGEDQTRAEARLKDLDLLAGAGVTRVHFKALWDGEL